MKNVVLYLKSRIKVIVMLVVIAIVQFVVFYLYSVPVAPVIYSLELLSFMLAVAVVFDYMAFYRRHKALKHSLLCDEIFQVELYDTSDEWIYSRTGIKERRVVSGEQNAVDLGLEAAQRALEKAKINPNDLDLIIAASSAPPDLYPAIACHIQTRLGITTQIPAFDITAACTGLIYALNIAKAYIASGMYKTILLVATDNNSRLVNWEDRGTSILFGDGAGAMVD